MSRVMLMVGTRKGVFLLFASADRRGLEYQRGQGQGGKPAGNTTQTGCRAHDVFWVVLRDRQDYTVPRPEAPYLAARS